MAEQLSFDLSARPALGREAFFVSEANAVALAMIDGWATWPGGKLLLTGAKGAGKTHLAHVWAEAVGAAIIAARDLPDVDVSTLATAPVCVEDVDTIAGQSKAETAMFHLHNLALAERQPLLMTAQRTQANWTLPDLASRLLGTTVARIDVPDEALLGALFGKLFADRQLSPTPDVIPYLARHAPRAFDAAAAIVEDMDRAALASGRALTRTFAREVLEART